MSFWRQLTRGLWVLRNRRAADQDIADEVTHHLEEATAAFVAQGLSPDEALRAARMELGGPAALREQMRAYGWENRIDSLVSDLRYAGRGLAADQGFTTVAILTLGLGIGASTAIFSLVDAVLLRALPYPNPQEIVRIWEQAPNGHRMNLADPNFDDFRTQNDTFRALAIYNDGLTSVSGGSEPVRVHWAEVSSGFFKALGISPVRGRAFEAAEQSLHGAPAVIVSYGYWRDYLGGADLTGLHLTTGDAVYSIVGVMPEGFDFPAGVSIWSPRELESELPSRTAHNWRCIGRLRDGVGIDQARANLSAIARRIKEDYGNKVDLDNAAVVPLADAMLGDVRTALLTLLAATGLLLLVACANVAGLLVARTIVRGKEVTVRAALGAGRGRLVQQFLVESFLLSFGGGLLGILMATWTVRVLPAILPANLPRREGIAMNAWVLLFALAVIVAVTVSLGLFAAWRSSGGDLREALSAGSRGYTVPVGQRLRAFLMVGEIAATLVILAAAGLLGRSFLRLISTSPGFSQRNLVTMEFSPPNPQSLVRQIHLMDDLLTRLRAIPGVEDVGLAGAMPVAAGDNLANGEFLILNGRKAPATFEEFGSIAQNPSRTGYAEYCIAGEDYFRTMGIPLMRGRMFGPQDDWESPHVAVISQALARLRWPDEDPVGQIIDFGNMDGNLKPLTIIGVAADIRASGLNLPAPPIIYVDYRQRGMNPNSSPTILMRNAAPLGETAAAARGLFRELIPDIPVKFSTFGDEMGGWLADRRFVLLLVSLFGAGALVLAAIGIYGVVAFSVTRRIQEIGIRAALGAQQSDMLRLVVGEGARLGALGVTIGAAVSLAFTRMLLSLLFGVSATDPLTFAGVAVLLMVVALIASYIPARRAVRLNPNTALRHE